MPLAAFCGGDKTSVIFDKRKYNHVVTSFEFYFPLYDRQHGFAGGRVCETVKTEIRFFPDFACSIALKKLLVNNIFKNFKNFNFVILQQ